MVSGNADLVALGLGVAAPREIAEGSSVHLAPLLDIAGRKTAVRTAARASEGLSRHRRAGPPRHRSPCGLAAGAIVYRRSFNPPITLKALSDFDDVPSLPADVQERLRAAVEAVDPARLPVLTPHARRTNDNGRAP
jgi:hypothetical protein